jgi:hypothetical protein
MTSWVVTYSDDRELDVNQLSYERAALISSGQLKLLKTGTGKVPAATTLAGHLTSSLRAGKAQAPSVVSVGVAATLEPAFVGQVVMPELATDRDMNPEVLVMRGLSPAPVVKLDGLPSIFISSGDRLILNEYQKAELIARSLFLLDQDSHALGWVAIRCLAGRAKSVRYVTHEVGSTPRFWEKTYERARKELTASVLQLTAGEKPT